MMRILLMALAVSLASGCVLHHSKQALWSDLDNVPDDAATFETEEDSGVSLFGIIQIAEPDHYSVLLERLRRRYQCTRMHHVQLDFYTDHWLLIAFPISRVTLICERAPMAAAVAEPTVAEEEPAPAGDEPDPPVQPPEEEEAL
jgi:hypothetical protein